MMQTVEADMNKCKVVTLIVSDPTINITLAAYESCTLPPMITAVEVFAKNDLAPVQGKDNSANEQKHLSLSHFLSTSVLCLVVCFIARGRHD
jgi:hypothetical protein